MQKGISFFIGVYVLLIIASGAAFFFSGDKPQIGQYAGMGMGVLVFGLGYLAHRISGAVGNPFNGLELGKFKWLFLSWLGGLLGGLAAIGVALGLSFVKLDPDMTWFLTFVAEQTAKSGQNLPESAMGTMKLVYQVISIASPLVGAPFFAAIMSLAFFPVYGWLARRLLSKGLLQMLSIMCVLGGLSTMASAFMKNPMYETHNLALALPIAFVYGVLLTASLLWLFLMSNSVIVPCLAYATFSAVVGSCQFYFADPVAHMVPPTGFSDLLVMMLVAMILWLTKVPDASRMEVAGVAFDGTSLNSQQMELLAATAGQAAGVATPDMPISPAPDQSADGDDDDGNGGETG